jgi:hypothetical protein
MWRQKRLKLLQWWFHRLERRSNFRKVHGVNGIAILAPPSVMLGVPDVRAPTDYLLIQLALFGVSPLALPCWSLDILCNVRGGLEVLIWSLATCIPSSMLCVTVVPTDRLALTYKQ